MRAESETSTLDGGDAQTSRSLIPAGLLRLILLRYRGALRRYVFGSGKKRVMTIVGLCLFAMFALPQFLVRAPMNVDPVNLRRWLPLGFMLLFGLSLLAARRRTSSGFLPAEVDLVFPGPFTRRQIVLYQVLHQAGILVLSAAWMSIFFRFGGTYLQRVLAIVLVLQAVNMVTASLSSLLGLLWSRGTAWVSACGVIALGLVAAMVWKVPHWPKGGDLVAWKHWMVAVRESPGVEILCVPFSPYVEIFAAADVAAALTWVSVALGVNVLLIALYVALDQGEIESMVKAVAKRQRRTATNEGITVANRAQQVRRVVPMLPWLQGVGPTMWRQLTVQYRRTGPIIAVAGPVAIAAIAAIGISMFGAIGWGVTGLVGFYLYIGMSFILRTDFRGDLDHMAHLRTVPIAPWAISLGQITASAGIMAGFVSALLLGVMAGTWPPRADVVWAAVILVLPLCFTLVAIDNAAFLLVPVRWKDTNVNAGFDPANMARHMLLMLVKTVAIGVLVLILFTSFAIGDALDLTFWFSAPLAVLILLPVDLGLLQICVVLFNRFDVAGDEPGS